MTDEFHIAVRSKNQNNFKDFLDLDIGTVLRLEAIGIISTLQLYEEVLTLESRKEFSFKTGICKNEVLTLTYYSDLSRIKGLNHVFIYLLKETGYITVEIIAKAEVDELYRDLIVINENSKFNTSEIHLNEIKSLVVKANKLNFEIEY